MACRARGRAQFAQSGAEVGYIETLLPLVHRSRGVKLDEAFVNNCDQVRFEEARAEIGGIIKQTVASGHADGLSSKPQTSMPATWVNGA